MSPVDPHSFTESSQPFATHIALTLFLDFSSSTILGSALITLPTFYSGNLTLDSREISVSAVIDPVSLSPVPFSISSHDLIKGSPITITLSSHSSVLIIFSTSPSSSALQWLSPAQTSSGSHPFVYTQCQSIHARSVFPCQDTPAARICYSARINLPLHLTAVMSASKVARRAPVAGEALHAVPDSLWCSNDRIVEYFCMNQPIPPYLFALAAGEISERVLGPRTTVYAAGGSDVLDAAAREFRGIEEMVRVGESLFGPYEWERFDLLVLPPSFPYGGMENPRMVFLTPTVIKGDDSGAQVVAHELAHSWTGNLITNKTNEDFWLNEAIVDDDVYMLSQHYLEYSAQVAVTDDRATDGRHHMPPEPNSHHLTQCPVASLVEILNLETECSLEKMMVLDQHRWMTPHPCLDVRPYICHEVRLCWDEPLQVRVQGFTTYAERRIVEAVQGKERADLNIGIGWRGLNDEIERFKDNMEFTKLKTKQEGVDPDDIYSQVPYEKGFQFLWRIERQIGRPAFDEFLKKYITTFKFQSIDTETFLEFLKTNLPGIENQINLQLWVEGTGIPPDAMEPESTIYPKIMSLAQEFKLGKMPREDEVVDWNGQEWELYLENLPNSVEASQVAALDARYRLSESRDWEVKVAFLKLAISSGCKEYFGVVDASLKQVGRMKYLRPLYSALVQGPDKEEEKILAKRIFTEAREFYHPIARGVIETIFSKHI